MKDYNIWYKLADKKPVPVNMQEGAKAFNDTESRRVGDTTIGDVRVSTVFLCIDHNFSGQGAPVLFETMVFGGYFDQEQERYCTWDEAEAGHKQWVARVEATSELKGLDDYGARNKNN